MFDNHTAFQEGWLLGNDSDGRVEIQRVDDPSSEDGFHFNEPLFDSDASALAFVTKPAEIGSYYHQQALSFVDGSVKELL